MIRTLKNSEIAVLRLRSLYESRGYMQFKMSRFEEYDLYAANKDFLAGEGIITFTDPSGRLMALKPDVTMSIIRSCKDGDGLTEKLYYSENVYRVMNGTHQLKEIMQSGLECIGEIDLYNTCEVISLAAKSLALFERPYVLDISHMGIVSGLVDECAQDESTKRELLRRVGAKNIHEIRELIGDKADRLITLLNISPEPEKGLAELEKLCHTPALKAACKELNDIIAVISGAGLTPCIHLDFSVVQDLSYYNGIVFQGFIEGIPEKILTGGRYDPLLRRIGKSKQAIGFGIDVDLLERTMDSRSEFDADIALIYKPQDDVGEVMRYAEKLSGDGKRVAVSTRISQKAKYRTIIAFSGSEAGND